MLGCGDLLDAEAEVGLAAYGIERPGAAPGYRRCSVAVVDGAGRGAARYPGEEVGGGFEGDGGVVGEEVLRKC